MGAAMEGTFRGRRGKAAPMAAEAVAPPAHSELVDFCCNICGTENRGVPRAAFGREDPSCSACGSSVRMRGIVHHLSVGLFVSSIALPQFPVAPAITGFGLSDWTGYADQLANRMAYTNTFYHQEPFLDIVAPPPAWHAKADFLISTDVLEHVPPPVERAFAGSYALLKPGGLMVLTVPFGAQAASIEHYPELDRFRVVDLGAGDYVVVNRTADGRLQVHENPIFHGGPGDTLEMRIFSRAETIRLLEQAGFVEIAVHEAAVPRWGILPPHGDGLPITARRPR